MSNSKQTRRKSTTVPLTASGRRSRLFWTPEPEQPVDDANVDNLRHRFAAARHTSDTLHSVLLTSGLLEQREDLAEDGVQLSTFHSSTLVPRDAWTQASAATAHSVLQNTGLDPHLEFIDVPDRFEAGNVKARVTWFGSMCMAGIGMFVEAYIIITTGQVKTIWASQYPTCWGGNEVQQCPQNVDCCCLFPNTPDTLVPNTDICVNGEYPDNLLCTERVTHSVSYAEFAGIMAGMLVIGAVADVIGRKRAGILTGCFMLVGITGMTFIHLNDIHAQFASWSSFFAILGFGVGGEYPLTASSAAEHHGEQKHAAKEDDWEQRQNRLALDIAKTDRRGETIALVFSMQGVGAFVGSLFLVVLIAFGQQSKIDCNSPASNSTGNNPMALNSIWRSFYFIGILMILFLIAYRFFVVEESQSFEKVKKRRERRKERQKVIRQKSTWSILWFYAPRLLGTAGNWFLWDIGFYGLKLFSGPIFNDINPLGDLMLLNGLLLLNSFIALLGYYAAAYLIDRLWIGRVRLQMCSYLICAVLFLVTALIFDSALPGVILLLFFLSSFFGQCGANVTTYVMAAETYPTELRSTCHGISAFAGKAGALMATVVFGFVETKTIFYITAATCLGGLVFTYLFSCDLTRVSLAEHDAQLELFLEGRPEKYKGQLNRPEHLSNFERWTGRHGEYDKHWARKLVAEEEAKHADARAAISSNRIASE